MRRVVGRVFRDRWRADWPAVRNLQHFVHFALRGRLPPTESALRFQRELLNTWADGAPSILHNSRGAPIGLLWRRPPSVPGAKNDAAKDTQLG